MSPHGIRRPGSARDLAIELDAELRLEGDQAVAHALFGDAQRPRRRQNASSARFPSANTGSLCSTD